ncbi:MAG TPA: hypothetical protein PKE00_08245 [Planctomycetota bacterium]|mgnify:CR=1 FL=1|nr:hypothetical protein [Planctomycetota bacterium]
MKLRKVLWPATAFVLASLVLGLVPACGGSSDKAGGGGGAAKKPSGISPAARVEAHQVFKTICTPCHGDTGHGDGPAAVTMDPKPRSFSDPDWQASVTDDHIKKVIVYGGAAVGKSPAMTGQPQLKDKPEVVDALVERIRKYKAAK